MENETQIVVKKRRTRATGTLQKASSGFRILQTIKLREAGLTWEETADEMGYANVAQCRALVANTLRKIDTEIVETWERLRRIEHQEISAIELFLIEQIEEHQDNVSDTVKLIDRLLKAKELKYSLLGIKSAEQVEITHQLPQIQLSLPNVPLNENKLVDRVITVRDSSNDLLED